jgi:hypothetical protein
MVRHTTSQLAGYDCSKLENDSVALWVTRSVGPRIMGLALAGGDNLLADLPDETTVCPGVGTFSFRGGHRLWYAPEDMRRTYLPDDAPPSFAEVENGLVVTQPVEVGTGIQKSLTITLPGPEARVVVDHTLHNRGTETLDLAPWAITQLKKGGSAILPQATALEDEFGLLPNRQLTLWPYTRINAAHVAWGDCYILVRATMEEGAFKIGFPNPAGWLAYALDGTLFVKQAAYQPDAAYFDRGSSSECYCNSRFLELETLGPRTALAPGESATHREIWTLYGGVPMPADEAAVQALVARLQLAA